MFEEKRREDVYDLDATCTVPGMEMGYRMGKDYNGHKGHSKREFGRKGIEHAMGRGKIVEMGNKVVRLVGDGEG